MQVFTRQVKSATAKSERAWETALILNMKLSFLPLFLTPKVQGRNKTSILFFSFWLHWVFTPVHGLSLVTVHRLLIAVTALGAKQDLVALGRNSCDFWVLEHTGFSSTWAQRLWCVGLVAPLHVESSQTRA